MTHNLGAARRLRKELQNLEQNKKSSKAQNEHDDIILRPTNLSKSILHWTALLRGPPDTPYEDGVFHISIKCNSDYPLSPPIITFVTPIFHPNIHFKTGDVCLDILKKEWSPAWGLQAACRAVLALLSDPDADSPLNCDAGNLVRNGDMTAYWCTARMYTVENAMMLSWPNDNSRILYYKRQLRLANEALEGEKEDFTKKMKFFEEREKALREKDLDLQESIVKCHDLIKDHEKTKTRETKRLFEERRRCEEIDQAILDVQKAIDDKQDEEKDLISLLDKNLKYKQYLEQIVDQAKESSVDFTDIQDILDRYSTLKSMNDCLVSKMEVNMKEHDARRLGYAQFIKKSGNEILNMNNDAARLQKELELVTVTLDKMERLEFGTYQNPNEVITEISQALIVIDNMIERLQCHAHSSLSNSSILPRISDMEGGLEKKVGMALERLDLIADLINDYDSILANTMVKVSSAMNANVQ